MSRDPHSIQFTITDLDKERKQYDLIPLRRKDAAFVMHSFLRTILKGLSEAVKKDQSMNMASILGALSEVEFDTLWAIAEYIFQGAEIKNVIKGKGEITRIDNLNDTDYFTENPDELYLAVYYGVLENYPKVFSKVRDRLTDLGLKISDQMKGLESQPETSDTPLTT